MEVLTTDRALLDAFRRGERPALARVYRAHLTTVVSLLRHGFQFNSGGRAMRFRGIDDPVELEACTQEVFLRAFGDGARLRYDGLRPYSPYLSRIAKNCVIDELRRRRSALERLVGPVEEADIPADEPLADAALEAERARRLVRTFVEGRPTLERRYICARFEDELSLLAAARKVGISRMKARVLEARLLRSLRLHLEQAGYVSMPASIDRVAWGVV